MPAPAPVVYWSANAAGRKTCTILNVGNIEINGILKHLGIDSVDTQDRIGAEVSAYLASKRIEAAMIGIRWNTVLLSADARNAELLRWEQDNLSSRISSLLGTDYKIKVKVTK